MRNGERFFSRGVPTERRTRAPAPSACSIARKFLAMPLGVAWASGLLRDGSLGGITGRP